MFFSQCPIPLTTIYYEIDYLTKLIKENSSQAGL